MVILANWRNFSKRYLCYRLLLGVIATTLGSYWLCYHAMAWIQVNSVENSPANLEQDTLPLSVLAPVWSPPTADWQTVNKISLFHSLNQRPLALAAYPLWLTPLYLTELPIKMRIEHDHSPFFNIGPYPLILVEIVLFFTLIVVFWLLATWLATTFAIRAGPDSNKF